MAINFSHIEDVKYVLDHHKAVKLLRKDHAPLIIAFLWSAFKAQHRHTFGSYELTTRLSDFLYSVNEQEEKFPREPRYYLESWTQDGFLRQYYEEHNDEATFELTPATERALLWITELDKREFVGAESRLLQVFALLRDLALGANVDKEARLTQLRQRQAEIAAEITALENDEVQRLDTTRIREQYFLIEETANKLLSDFREIEENFRQLNTQAREEQINRQGSRGEILDDIFSAQDAILETDQGRTFDAFWNFLMDQQSQDELDSHIKEIFNQPELEHFEPDSQLPRLKMALVAAGDRVNKTTDRLVEQLRRFLQSHTFLEAKRTAQVVAEIEQLALAVKNDPPAGRYFTSIEGKAIVQLVMDRGPFDPPEIVQLHTGNIKAGDATQVNAAGLYEQLYINPDELRGRIQALLRGRDQISLREVTEEMPIEKGLSEVIAYFSIATAWEPQKRAVINTDRMETILYAKEGKNFRVEMPETIYIK